MSVFQTIMVALDLSKYSPPTVQYAAQLAKRLTADLIFVNVINQRDLDAVHVIATTYESFPFDQFVAGRTREREEKLKGLIDNHDDIDPNTVRIIIRTGVPYQQLLEVIAEESPDLLVMAVKGRTDLVDVVMGSCARSMYRRCPIPLLSIRGDQYFGHP